MVTVNVDAVRVEFQLSIGALWCPSCGDGRLAAWGWARTRSVGREQSRVRVRLRRSRCRSCRVTHVLLPVSMLSRRGDWVATIGRALELSAAGAAQTQTAIAMGVPRSTVRGWIERFGQVAEHIRSHLVGWALWLAPGLVRFEPAGSRFRDAVAAVIAAGEQAATHLEIGCRWEFVSAATRGALLCNTTPPFPGPWIG